MRVANCLRLVVWGNFREGRYEHLIFRDKGAVFVSRCQIYGFKLMKMFAQPAVFPTKDKSYKLDAEIYAVTYDCLAWADEQIGNGFDRVNVLAYMFDKDAPKDPATARVITGTQCAWIHFYTKPEPKNATAASIIYDFPNHFVSEYAI